MQNPISDSIPSRVRVLILGGGIHGAGVLHDMVSRGWRDVHLIEKGAVGCGTSSRSTKLIHGGLRYLKNIQDFTLVSEALRERSILRHVAPDLVHPLELILPVFKGEGLSPFLLKVGLSLYDLLAGKASIKSHRRLSSSEVLAGVPILTPQKLTGGYSFWDMQTDDLKLVRRVVASARRLGGGVSELTKVEKIIPDKDGWLVDLTLPDGKLKRVSALYVVNALGPWANRILETSGLTPEYQGVNNEGIHIIVRDLGLKSGLLLQSPDDNRIFFILPWNGYTIIGTTEQLFMDNPDQIIVKDDAIQYLLDRCNHFLKSSIHKEDILVSFSGLRWLAVDPGKALTSLSRNHVIAEQHSQRGVMYTIYGGKLTTYRRLSEIIGGKILHHFGDNTKSKTDLKDFWISQAEDPSSLIAEDGFVDPIGRFEKGGITYTPREKSAV